MSEIKALSQLPYVWVDCHGCGALQVLPAPQLGYSRICWRCHTDLGNGIIRPNLALVLALTALFLFFLTQSYPIMGIEVSGVSHAARIISGVSELADYNLPSVGLLVLAIAIAAPLGRIVTLIWVLACLLRNKTSPYVTQIYKICEHLRPWAMLDVLLLGSIVASSKLREIVHLSIGIGFWALVFVVLVVIMMELAFDRRALWDALYPPLSQDTPPDPKLWASCHTCHFFQKMDPGEKPCRCIRCGTAVYKRKKASFSRTWALVIGGFILYIPANIYPVITTISFGQVTPSTIMGGVKQLLSSHNGALAIILFAASILVPLLKLLGLSLLMILSQIGSSRQLINRTKLYRCILFIGRWSNTDIVVGALLTGLVTLGNISTVIPGNGALAFGAVVVLTMIAAETFDSRLMWDAAGLNHV